MALTKPYRNIYNMDSSGILMNSTGVEDYTKGVVGFLEDSHVDALFWMDGAGGNTANYESAILEFTGQHVGTIDPALWRLIDSGNDPPSIMVREAKERDVDVFYSLRLNDCHDSLGHDSLLAAFKTRNPEWTIGRGHAYGGHLNLNFAIERVRDLKLAVIEEIFQKYGFDGLEIDFLRSTPYFIPGEEPQNADLLTQFLRSVRRHLNRVGSERGRPIALAARVGESLESCDLDGFDVATWIEEDLLDILVLGSGAIDIAVEDFKQLTEGTDVRVYPCLYAWPSSYNPISTEMARALATNYWHQGADGIYTFNWNAHSHEHRPQANAMWAYQRPLLNEIDDPESLRGKNKRFAADRGRPTRVYPHNWMHCVLPVRLEAGNWAGVSIMVGEDFTEPPAPERIELIVDCEELSDEDLVGANLNRQSVGAPRRVGPIIKFELTPDQLETGRNQVQLWVDAGSASITAVEIDVRY